MRVLILGAGGHAQVVADILLQTKTGRTGLELVGYLDDDPALAGQNLLGLPVWGPLAALSSIAHEAVIVAMGDNMIRRQVYAMLTARNEYLLIARHPCAVIAPDVQIGPGSMVCAGVVVNPGSVVGANVILNTGCTVDHHNYIADHVHIGPGVHLGGEVEIGEGALVGIGATVMPGCRVGAWSVVGAGALVYADLPDGVTAVGVPARVVRKSKTE